MARYFKRKRFCRFTAEGIDEIDYKDLNILKNYLKSLPNSLLPGYGTLNRLLVPTWIRSNAALSRFFCV